MYSVSEGLFDFQYYRRFVPVLRPAPGSEAGGGAAASDGTGAEEEEGGAGAHAAFVARPEGETGAGALAGAGPVRAVRDDPNDADDEEVGPCGSRRSAGFGNVEAACVSGGEEGREGRDSAVAEEAVLWKSSRVLRLFAGQSNETFFQGGAAASASGGALQEVATA